MVRNSKTKTKKMKVKVTRLCSTLCNPMDCSLPGSSVHGILQARTLDWVVVPFSRGSSQPRGQTQVEPNVIEPSLQADPLPFEPTEKQKKMLVLKYPSTLEWINILETLESYEGILHSNKKNSVNMYKMHESQSMLLNKRSKPQNIYITITFIRSWKAAQTKTISYMRPHR